MSPALEPLPDGFYAEIGSEEHRDLVARSDGGELSRAMVLDDVVNKRASRREVFCPRDFDVTYVSDVAHKLLGIMGLEWTTPRYAPEGCRIAGLEQYIEIYNSSHNQ